MQRKANTAEGSRGYRAQLKLKKQSLTQKETKSLTERSRECRSRKRLDRTREGKSQVKEDSNCASVKDIRVKSLPTPFNSVTEYEQQQGRRISADRSCKYKARVKLRKQQKSMKNKQEVFVKKEDNLESSREKGENSISELSSSRIGIRRVKTTAGRSLEYRTKKKLQRQSSCEDLIICKERNSKKMRTVSSSEHQDQELKPDSYLSKDSSSCLRHDSASIEENQQITIKEEPESLKELIQDERQLQNSKQQEEISIKIEPNLEYLDLKFDESEDNFVTSKETSSDAIPQEVKIEIEALTEDSFLQSSASATENEDQPFAPDSNESYCCLYHGPSSVHQKQEAKPKKKRKMLGIDKWTQTDEIFDASNFFNGEEKENSDISSTQNCNCAAECKNNIEEVTISLDGFPGPSSPENNQGSYCMRPRPERHKEIIKAKTKTNPNPNPNPPKDKILYYGTSIGGFHLMQQMQSKKIKKQQMEIQKNRERQMKFKKKQEQQMKHEEQLKRQQIVPNFLGNKVLYYGTSIGGPQRQIMTSVMGQHPKQQTRPKNPMRKKLEYKARREALKRFGKQPNKKNPTKKRHSKEGDDQSDPTGEYLDYLTQEIILRNDEERLEGTENSQVNCDVQIKTEPTDSLDYHFLYDLVKS